eukprot:TRINITY_DN33001_c0_g1_i1.p1 TRINITY_DN33001_c0_g1~~TRINITY_DN33001_c0_g1_i1.p1  ORF type:complete len:117 (+),score=6.82 TRINITY_DN33001_c0_g1_i1:60-410(+)
MSFPSPALSRISKLLTFRKFICKKPPKGLICLQLCALAEAMDIPLDEIVTANPSLLHNCKQIENPCGCKPVHARILKLGLECNLFLGNRLIPVCMKCGKPADAHRLYHTPPLRELH